MAEDKNSTRKPTRADHLANERTFLSWIRTSLGVMAFGFVVQKFALFIKQIASFMGKQPPTATAISPSHTGYSAYFGIILIAFGALMGIFALFEYRRVGIQIENDSYKPSAILPMVLTISIILMALVLIIYLVNPYLTM